MLQYEHFGRFLSDNVKDAHLSTGNRYLGGQEGRTTEMPLARAQQSAACSLSPVLWSKGSIAPNAPRVCAVPARSAAIDFT